jgi:hypothetical protein
MAVKKLFRNGGRAPCPAPLPRGSLPYHFGNAPTRHQISFVMQRVLPLPIPGCGRETGFGVSCSPDRSIAERTCHSSGAEQFGRSPIFGRVKLILSSQGICGRLHRGIQALGRCGSCAPAQARYNRGSAESDAGNATQVIASHLAVPWKCSRRTRASGNRSNFAGASRRCECENAGIHTYLSRRKTDDLEEASVHFRDKCLSHF